MQVVSPLGIELGPVVDVVCALAARTAAAATTMSGLKIMNDLYWRVIGPAGATYKARQWTGSRPRPRAL
jgi:hypothetical protein